MTTKKRTQVLQSLTESNKAKVNHLEITSELMIILSCSSSLTNKTTSFCVSGGQACYTSEQLVEYICSPPELEEEATPMMIEEPSSP